MLSIRLARVVIVLVAGFVAALVFTPAVSAQNRYNCPDFSYQEDAQVVYNQNPADPNRLDRDKDGIACEQLPRRGGGGVVTIDDVASGASTAPQAGLPPTGASDTAVGLVLTAGVALIGAGVAVRRGVQRRLF